ncbi:polysaccharide deacetylase family protein [Microbacterium sp. HD4P20]|uniref:polysaccharide deacetylase family protein n=1 Tax=Microbacterium sp. HD4P20 TaxID=2864874 RepID=UPI001C6420DF|nr:polysaccharide deacetylase family protein [Microbacterium sp. HD4P20]MCP2637404.1 polysaccharide deacetylase family protein [Microbacterium sp. HD4P20]
MDADAFSALPAFRIRNDDVGVQARWIELPGRAAFDSKVTEIVRASIDARVSAGGVAYAPAVSPPGSGLADRGCISGSTNRTASDILADPLLGPKDGAGVAVVCDIVVATGPYLGQRIRAVSSDSTDTTVVVYANTSTGEAATADELWAHHALVTLHGEIVNLLRRDTDSLGVSVQSPDDAGRALMSAALAQTIVTPDGTLVVPVAAGFTSPELRSLGITPTTERLIIGVPAGLAANLLTPLGADLLSVATRAGQFTPPATTPAGRDPVDCTLVPCVALTYDDGPSEFTPGILDELAKRHGSATFFITGERARFNVELLKRTLDEGHLVENHTFSHPDLAQLSSARVAAEIEETNAAILAATGVPARVFRPPYGEYNDMVLQTAGMAAILWDVDSLDYAKVSDHAVLSRAVDLPRPGSIVLQHDIHPNTARTAGAVYDGLLDRGFVLVNLEQLFNGELPTSGVIRRLP